ncbi:unnamed protein product [Brachionus calyciflorus]|uniref:SH3 domain-containing protein n=1 Tax=Brachionus calyciflorus TaxID=104777 RepID=A0A813YQ32_9BILA|nr:unnamed protein product [Brachionus calyciflorus]
MVESKPNSRSTNLRKNLKDKLIKLETNDEENLISPRSARSVTEKTDDEKALQSARSDQKLIPSETEEKSEKVKKTRAKRPKSKEILDKVVKEGVINDAYEPEGQNKKEENLTEKPPRRARKVKTKIDSEPESKVLDPESNILAVIVHQTDKLRTDVNIYNPVVRVHIVDLDADGQYVKKIKKDRNTLIYYEKENRKLDYVSPIMTTPFDFKHSRTTIPRWEEVVVFNEEFSHFVKEHPNVLILFELIDYHIQGDSTSRPQSYTSQETSKDWQRIAWAFLKLKGLNNTLNTEKKLRLQLYYTQSKYKFNVIESMVPEVYNLYKNGPKVKYPASLHITVKSINQPKNFLPGVGSSDYLAQEFLGYALINGSNKTLDEIKNSTTSLKQNIIESEYLNDPLKYLKSKQVIWSRLAGLPCRVPNELSLKLNSSKNGCYSLKFSNTGNFLACACIEDNSNYPILVYDIPDGKFNMKFHGHFGLVYEISWSKLDKYIVTASNDATARVIDFESKSKEPFKILPHPNFLYSAKFVPDSLDIIVTAGYDKVIRVWSIGNTKKKFQKFGELLQELYGHNGFINTTCFSTDGSLFYSADSAGEIKTWNCPNESDPKIKEWSFREDISVKELKNEFISFIQLLPNQFRLLVQLRDNQLSLIDTRIKSVVQRYKGTYSFSQNLKSAISPCGTFLFNSGSDTKIHCWNINNGDQLETISLNYIKPSRDIDFHPYDNYIAFCSYDTNSPIYVFKHNPEKINIADHNLIKASINLKAAGQAVNQKELNKMEEMVEESELDKRLKNDIKKFKNTQDNIWKMVNEKLDSVYPRGSKASNNSQDIWSKNVKGSITMTMPDSARKPEFKYRGPKEVEDIVVAIYDYKAQRGDELDLKIGDEILVLVRENENWWLGEVLRTKQEGYFPAGYVQEKSALDFNKNPIPQQRIPKFTVKDAMAEFEKVIEPVPFGLSDTPSVESPSKLGKTIGKTERKPFMTIVDKLKTEVDKIDKVTSEAQRSILNDETQVSVINEVPTKDESSSRPMRKRDQTKRRTYAHLISGSHLSSSDI